MTTAKRYRLMTPEYEMIHVDSAETLHDKVNDFLTDRGLAVDGNRDPNSLDIFRSLYAPYYLGTVTVGDYLLIHSRDDAPAQIHVTQDPSDFEEV